MRAKMKPVDTFGRQSALLQCVLLSCGIASCDRAPGVAEREAPAGQVMQSAGLDSARAVSLALQAYEADKGSGALAVAPARFQRDSAGILIYLSPVDRNVQGGGMLVRVGNDGRVEIIGRSQ